MRFHSIQVQRLLSFRYLVEMEVEEDETMEELEPEATAPNIQENNMLRELLTTYQMLNKDLSKKVQEFKISMNATNRELITTRDELLAEKMRTSELRRIILTLNGQVCQFTQSYVYQMQQHATTANLELTLPINFENFQSEYKNAESNLQEPSTLRPPRKMPKLLDIEGNCDNLLETICENDESVNENRNPFSPINFNAASTPFLQPNNSFATANRSETSTVEESMSESAAASTPFLEQKASFAKANRSETSKVEESISESAATPNLFLQATRRTPQKGFTESRIRTRRGSQTLAQLENYSENEVKGCKVILDRAELNDLQLKEYKENYMDAKVETESDSSTSSRQSKKEKAKARTPPVVRRNDGRPKRKASILIATLAERSMKTKLRRSK